MANITAQDWAEAALRFRALINANDDDLRSYSLGAIRACARDDDLDGIKAIIAGLDEVLNGGS